MQANRLIDETYVTIETEGFYASQMNRFAIAKDRDENFELFGTIAQTPVEISEENPGGLLR